MPVKALVVEQDVSDSALDWAHGVSYTIKRTLVPFEAERMLAVTFHKDNVYVFPMEPPLPKDSPMQNSLRIVREVEVSDDFARHAREIHDAQNSLKREFETLLPLM